MGTADKNTAEELPQPVQQTEAPVLGAPADAPKAAADFPVFQGDVVAEQRELTLEEVAKEHRNGRRIEHRFHRDEVQAEIVRQIQERVPRK